jgi:hypothetical protein
MEIKSNNYKPNFSEDEKIKIKKMNSKQINAIYL